MLTQLTESFKNYFSTLAENLVSMLPLQPENNFINTIIKYEHVIQGDHFASVSEKSILTTLKAT